MRGLKSEAELFKLRQPCHKSVDVVVTHRNDFESTWDKPGNDENPTRRSCTFVAGLPMKMDIG